MATITTLERLEQLIPAAAPMVAAKIRNHLDSQAISFVARSPFLVMASQGAAGLELSPKGDDPGFVAVVDDRTLLIPERKGNRLTLGLRNLLQNDHVGIAMFRPAAFEVLRVRGRAQLIDDPAVCLQLQARGEPAILVIRVTVHQAYFHCARSLKRARLWEPTTWDPPSRISFGQIYAEALHDEQLGNQIDALAEKYNSDL